MDIWNDEDREQIARIYKGAAHPVRIAFLAGLREERSPPDIADRAGVTRGTLQTHIERLIESDLIFRPGQGDSYALTPLGEYVLMNIEEDLEELGRVSEEIEFIEESVREDLEPARDVLTEKEFVRKMHTQKWEQAINEIDKFPDEDI